MILDGLDPSSGAVSSYGASPDKHIPGLSMFPKKVPVDRLFASAMLGTCMPDPGLALDKYPLYFVNSRSYLCMCVGIIDQPG